MASILVVGPDTALLEGISQTLVGADHKVVVARDVAEALELLQGARPLVAVVHMDELLNGGSVFRVTLAQGGALIAFHSDETDAAGLPFQLQRAMLAELRLPLERQRLLALVKFVESRARAAGRDSSDEDATEARTS
ncbi:MAG: hypothetical protein Q7S20_06350 [Gemmatimonadaceae bacterium]|nr:hypothetical protein [Gemmatimonadaceae bacterium]